MAIAPTAAQIKAPAGEKLMTAEELLKLPQQDRRYELVKGELIEMSPASTRHGRIANSIAFFLTEYAIKNKLGAVYAAETGFQLAENPDTVRAADAAFVAQERIPPEGEPEGYWAIAPDLVVEVVSPSDSAQKIQAKVTDWLRAGCRLVWVIYPDTQTVTEYRSLSEASVLSRQQKLEGGKVLPGFECLIEQLFS